jgi:hypothetical protein
MQKGYFIVAALLGVVGASSMALAASSQIHAKHVASNTASQAENAPLPAAAWNLPQGWPHTP